MSVSIEIRLVQGVQVLDVNGRITLGEGATELRDAVRSVIRDGGKKVLLNLGEVAYIDSSGLGALVSSFATMNNAGGQIKLLNVTKRVQDLLLITKLLTVFETYDDEPTALRSFACAAVAS